MSTVSTSDLYYDSADFEIARNPYPVFKRLRDEAPLYYNDDRDFYAVSRFDDVASVLVRQQDLHQQVRRHHRPHQVGDRDPAGHRPVRGRAVARHPSLVARAAFFTPKNVAALDGQIRQFCTDVLDALEPGGFDFAADIGEIVPMRVIGMLLGLSPEQQDESAGRWMTTPLATTALAASSTPASSIDYVKWRKDNPSNDVVTKLLNAEYEDDRA